MNNEIKKLKNMITKFINKIKKLKLYAGEVAKVFKKKNCSTLIKLKHIWNCKQNQIKKIW